VLLKVTVLQGQVMTVAAVIAFVVAVVGRATLWPKANIWPYEIPALLAGLTGMVGWVIYRDRGEGDDSAAERAGTGADPYRIGP
jgi:fatty acid desaturase